MASSVTEASVSYSQAMDGEYEKFIRTPRVVIDNECCKNATVIHVDSPNKHRMPCEVIEVLNRLNLTITKAYIHHDGGRFMDVFNVTDQDGNKITDEGILYCIQKSLGPDSCFASSMRRSDGVVPAMDYTSIELTGSDRLGLLSDVGAVLTHLQCNVVNAKVWTHNTRAAAVMQVTDEETGGAIIDFERLSRIKRLLCNELKGSNKSREAKTGVSHGITYIARRLSKMMFADQDYERSSDEASDEKERPNVNVVNWHDKDYLEVTIRGKDRPKLLFDTICTLTDMRYVVFHGNAGAEGTEAYQEYCIRHADGLPFKSDAERQRVIQCLEAAIVRRVSKGVKLELCTTNRVGLLDDVTQMFRENSLTVTRAEVTTRAGKAVNKFYVCIACGYPVDAKDKRHGLPHGKMGEAMPNIEDCIISQREKLKETDEYKRAIGEEWASRQQELKIQAEEAQRLRRLQKRRKAETMRLLDTKRRQKQRVEEIRETQKKDEENMKLKEVIGAQVRQELDQLEARCHDMTSLLQELGIFVSNAETPSSSEVRSAYKRALLTFHPDRASRSDIHQQVKAEEIFKLISRLKEKLLPA